MSWAMGIGCESGSPTGWRARMGSRPRALAGVEPELHAIRGQRVARGGREAHRQAPRPPAAGCAHHPHDQPLHPAAGVAGHRAHHDADGHCEERHADGERQVQARRGQRPAQHVAAQLVGPERTRPTMGPAAARADPARRGRAARASPRGSPPARGPRAPGRPSASAPSLVASAGAGRPRARSSPRSRPHPRVEHGVSTARASSGCTAGPAPGARGEPRRSTRPASPRS